MPGQSMSETEARRRGVFRNVLYRAYPTGRDYSFTYELPQNTWRAYINNVPDYRGRPSGSSSAHWLRDGGRRYVCWTPEPTTISTAQGTSAMWADATEHYIRTGRFEPPGDDRRSGTTPYSAIGHSLRPIRGTAASIVTHRDCLRMPASAGLAGCTPAAYHPKRPSRIDSCV